MTPLAMYCDQCEQAAHNAACTTQGVCGKGPNIESLQKLLLAGLKGLAAYKSHARRLGSSDSEVDAFLETGLFATMTNVNFDRDDLLELIRTCGRMSYATLQSLDRAHTGRLGRPEVTEVAEGRQPGPGILVSGHDMVDLLALLEQCEGTDVRIYTHGEMLPAHTYPRLRAFGCLAGHFGGAWQHQRWDFERFGGPVVVTTNCVLVPWATNAYLPRLYTTGQAAVPGAKKVRNNDFSEVIAHAKSIGDLTTTVGDKRQVGWHHSRILDLTSTLVEGLRDGQIEHIFIIGGCDGAEPGRNYFTKYAEATPKSSFILTMGCGKYRVCDVPYGEIRGIPRMLDLGQCNDSFGGMQVALSLAKALGTHVDALPLTIQLSWFEQKTIAILLAFFHLGFRGIRLGPSLPAFLSNDVADLLVEQFDLRPIGSNPREDVRADLAMA